MEFEEFLLKKNMHLKMQKKSKLCSRICDVLTMHVSEKNN